MVEITQYALNQRSPTEGKGNVQKLSGKPPHALKGQKLSKNQAINKAFTLTGRLVDCS